MTAPWRETARGILTDLIADHPMWIGDDGKPLDYLPEREARIGEFVDEALGGIERLLTAARAGALREFADTRGVNVGDEDDDWWRGYRQAQRECLHDAADAAARIARTATSTEEGR